MQKKITSWLYILLLVMATTLVLPGILGIVAKSKCQNLVEIVNSATVVSAKITKYRHGWFSSRAKIIISLDKLFPTNGFEQITLKAKIHHGPFFINWARFKFVQATANAEIELSDEQNRLLNRTPSSPPLAQLKIRFKPSGTAEIILESPKFSYQRDNNYLNWQGLRAKVIFSPLYNQASSDLNFTGFDACFDEHSLKLADLTTSYHGKKEDAGVWLGERSLQIGFLKSKNKNGHTITVTNFKIKNLLTNNSNNRLDLNLAISSDKVEVNDTSYDQNNLDLEFTELDQTLFGNIQKLFTSTKLVFAPQNIVLDLIASALNNQGEIRIKRLSSNTSRGKLFASIKLICDNQASIGWLTALASSSVTANVIAEKSIFLYLLEKFYQNINSTKTSMPADIRAKNTLVEWQKDGSVLKTNEEPALEVKLEYKDNQFSINGKPLIIKLQS